MTSRTLLAALLLALTPGLAGAQAADRLKRIKDTGTIAVAHRTDAAPFSFLDNQKNPVGYSIDLCKRVISQLESQLGVRSLKVKWVP
ncbi:MAG TPA: hypothetical protein VFV90_07955, partial [Usitatibacter sp.]|nr:hypothetical protein [Usitatibacter sp.]